MAGASRPSSLTTGSWNDLFDFLDPQRRQKGGESRDAAAIARLLEIRRKLVCFYAARGCRDSEDLAEDTILRVAGKCREVSEIYEGDRTRYFYGFARRILHEAVKRKPPPLPLPEPDPWDVKEPMLICLERCLDRLTPRVRRMMIAYYRDEGKAKIERRRELAEQIGRSANGLRIYIHRVKKTLRRCVVECMGERDHEMIWNQMPVNESS